ncbi:amidohydrolase [Paenisporosarcina sp. HGH0030]|uniref:M20 peptidase aminoacylase family protein n=1 Tax=Paenisporosarcina sp. HGH0030 TaxID=1078085 RepID=UPI00034ECE28|nr:M20 peptidase aminoacylase family protein [Paenisporosarcina sp. HGH0030]EPD49763.1 amidohydrolase [Paenisporosarcina sp. HGH0030]
MKESNESHRARINEVFDYLHAHPEVSWKEVGTTAYLKKLIEQEGFTVQTFDECTGLVVEVGEGETCIGIRADMDALWQEVNSVFKANHSCGHDAHMTMGVGTLLAMKEIGFPEDIRLKWIFQPAEEKGQGALKLLSLGVLDNVDYLYGVHLRPIQEIPNGTASAAICHGAAGLIKGTIQGEDAHAARPHLGKNAIEVGAAIIQGLQAIRMDPLIPCSVKMTKLQAGSETGNIIPGKASFTLDLRAQTNDAMRTLRTKVCEVIQSVESIYHVKIQYIVHEGLVAAIVNEEAYDLMAEAICEVIGADNLQPRIETPGGEDFHFYSLYKPNIKATMLGLGCDLSPGLHHPNMTFNHNCLHTGIAILTQTILNTIKSISAK